MTFETFDAAMQIGGEGFPALLLGTAAITGGEGAEGATLEAALRALGGAERAAELPAAAGDLLDRRATRAEALVFDLWVERPEARDLRSFDDLALARLAAGAGSRAWLLEPGDDVPAPGPGDGDAAPATKELRANFDDVDGDGVEDGPIDVTGKRPRSYDDDWTWIPGGDPGGDTGGGPSVPTPDDQEQNDCRDRRALDAKTDIQKENWHYKEFGIITYRDANGVVRNSTAIEGTVENIPRDRIVAWMNANGVSFSQVIGFVHNHPSYFYGNAPEINRYPSGGDVPGGDWNAADWFVNNGAGGPGGDNFALYIIDIGGKIREFEYSDRDKFMDLNDDQRTRGVDLPDEVVSDGSSCG